PHRGHHLWSHGYSSQRLWPYCQATHTATPQHTCTFTSLGVTKPRIIWWLWVIYSKDFTIARHCSHCGTGWGLGSTFESVLDFPAQFDVAPKHSETSSGVGVCPIHELHMQMRHRRVPGISYLCDLVTYFNPDAWPNNDRALPEVGIRREGSIVVPDDDVVSKQGTNTEYGPKKPLDRHHEGN